MIFENRIFREWVVRDNMALFLQLGLETHAYAERVARDMLSRGVGLPELSENRRILGQMPPEESADLSIAHSDLEAMLLGWLHEIYNKRMLGKIRDVLRAERDVARSADARALWPGRGACADRGDCSA